MKYIEEEIEEEGFRLCPYKPVLRTENIHCPIKDPYRQGKPTGTRTHTSFEQCIGIYCMAFNREDNTCKKIQ